MTPRAQITPSTRSSVASAGERCCVRAVHWPISPDALRAYAPAVLNGHASELVAAMLTIELAPLRAVLMLTYARGDRAEHALPVPATAALSIDGDDGRALEHVNVSGVVSLCIRRARDARPVLVYAQTPLLAALGLPGGVYDVPSITLTDGN